MEIFGLVFQLGLKAAPPQASAALAWVSMVGKVGRGWAVRCETARQGEEQHLLWRSIRTGTQGWLPQRTRRQRQPL